jgi:hypothetical protein
MLSALMTLMLSASIVALYSSIDLCRLAYAFQVSVLCWLCSVTCSLYWEELDVDGCVLSYMLMFLRSVMAWTSCVWYVLNGCMA